MLLPLFVAVGITTIIDFTKRCAIELFYGMFYGRCYCHVADVIATILCFVLLADVIAMWLMFLPLFMFCFVGRCYSHVADVVATVM